MYVCMYLYIQILFGEHAVVHGITAIATALTDLRIIVEIVSIYLYLVGYNIFDVDIDIYVYVMLQWCDI